MEMPCRSEISFNGINSSCRCCAKSIIKRSAYLPRVDIFIFSYRKTSISDRGDFVKEKKVNIELIYYTIYIFIKYVII